MKRVIKFRAYTEISNEVLGMKYDVSHNYNDTVMQFTGLLDKHGKEIYEGDILEDEEADKFLVTYTKFARFVADLHGEKGFVYDEFALDDRHWEIIGNIYENPELLNKNI